MPVASSLQVPSSAGQHIEACTVALELGAKGGRVCFVWNGKAELLPFDPIHCTNSRADKNISFTVGRARFPIVKEMLKCIIGSDDVTYHGSIKAALHVIYIGELRTVLGRTTHETKLRKSFPILEKFFQLYDKLLTEESVLVVRHVQHLLLEHLEQLRDTTRQMANSTRCVIMKLITAFPSGWTSWTQKYIAACLQVVWDLPPENVHLILESEATAHHFLWIAQIAVEATSKSRKILEVFLDEFALGVSITYAVCHNRGPKRFCLLSGQKDAYVHSGIHRHASLVRAAIRDHVQNKQDIYKHEKQDIISQFMTSYQETWGAATCSHAFTIQAASSSGVHYEICFNAREARKMYNTCFAHILEILDESVEDKEEEENEKAEQTEVVLTGCGFMNARLRGDVEKWAKKRNMRLHDSGKLGFDAHKSGSIAVGAAYATLNSTTVEEFMRTACFAIRNSSDKKKSGLIIWRNNSPVSSRIRFLPLEADGMSVMCAPFPETEGVISIDIGSSYEIFKLRALKPGDYDVHMEYAKSVSGKADEVTIVFGDIHCPTSDGNEVQVFRSTSRFQIYFDCGPRLCFQEIDQPGNLVSDLARRAHAEEPEILRLVTHQDLEMRIRAHMAHRSGCDQIDIEPPACRCKPDEQRRHVSRANSPPPSMQVAQNRRRQASASASNASRAMNVRNQASRAGAKL